MIGSSGTTRRPPFRVMAVPLAGDLRIEKFGIRSRPRFGVTGSSQNLWKSLWKTQAPAPFAPHQIGSFMRFAPRWCGRCRQAGHYNPQVHIVIADSLPTSAADALRAAGWTVDTKAGRKPDELARDLADADALIVRSATQVTASLLESAPKLRVVARAGTGVDNVDVPAA